MTRFTDLPILPSDGIPAAAIEARQDAFEQLYNLCRAVHMADNNTDDEVQDAIEQLPAVLKALHKPLIPKQPKARRPRLRVGKAGAA